MNIEIYKKIAASVAVVFSIFSIIEGTQVLFGMTQTEYIVLKPLLIYNVAMGLVGVFVGITLWLNNRRALMLTSIVAAMHLTVLLIVVVIYLSDGAVAMHSVKAMIIRSVVWIVIAVIAWKTNKSEEFNSKGI